MAFWDLREAGRDAAGLEAATRDAAGRADAATTFGEGLPPSPEGPNKS